MLKVTVNNELELTCPDSFHVMDEEERGTMNMQEGSSWTGLSCPDKNIIVTIGWKKIGLIASLLLSPKDLAKGTERQITESLIPYRYADQGRTRRNIAGNTARGFSYSYEAQETRMRGECTILKLDRTIYYLYLYARENRWEESAEVWEEILASAKKI